MNVARTPLRIAAIALVAAAAVGCASTAPSNGYSGGSAGYGASCMDCGTVTRIETGVGSRAPNATGAVIGGIVGAVAAREVAKDRTDSTGRQNTATVAGAAAGAAVGNAIQNRTGTGGSYNVYVRMNDGRETVVTQSDIGGIRQGSYVRVYNGRVWAR